MARTRQYDKLVYTKWLSDRARSLLIMPTNILTKTLMRNHKADKMCVTCVSFV